MQPQSELKLIAVTDGVAQTFTLTPGAVIEIGNTTLLVQDGLPTAPQPDAQAEEWSDQRERIVGVLKRCSGNQTRAAQLLNVSRRTLVSWLVRYRIPRPHKPLPGPPEPRATTTNPTHDNAEFDEWTLERQRIIDALESCHGNQTRAAKLLRMSRRTLVSRLVTHRIPRPRKALPGGQA